MLQTLNNIGDCIQNNFNVNVDFLRVHTQCSYKEAILIVNTLFNNQIFNKLTKTDLNIADIIKLNQDLMKFDKYDFMYDDIQILQTLVAHDELNIIYLDLDKFNCHNHFNYKEMLVNSYNNKLELFKMLLGVNNDI